MKLNLGSVERKDPETASEKVHHFVLEHRAISGLTIVGILSLFFFKLVPLSWLSVLPGWVGKGLIMLTLAQIVSWYPSRWLYKKIRNLPIDIIVAADSTENEIVKPYQYYQGRFKQDFDIDGEPSTWRTPRGKTAFLVTSLDEEEMKAEGTSLGEMSDIELLKAREKIEANRLNKRKWAKVGMKLFARFESIEDQVKTEYFQNLVRKGLEHTSYDPDKLLETVEEEIPELQEDSDEETDLADLISEVDPDAEVSQKIEISGNDEDENDGE